MELKQFTRCCFLAILFLLVSEKASASSHCKAQADIVFLLDSSGSVGSGNFQKVKSFVHDLMNSFDIGPGAVQVGVDSFETSVTPEFNLNRYHNRWSVQNAINNIPYYSGGSTNTAAGIRFMATDSFSAARGDRPNVPNVAIVVTDGNSNNAAQTAAEAKNARDAGITMLAVGIGSDVSLTELNAIATDSTHVFTTDNFDALQSLKAILSTKACVNPQNLDQDECAAGTDNCDANATCRNTVGSFTCVCNTGYIGNGVTCTDVDECTSGLDNCDVNAQCTNTVGSFTCACNTGYTGNGVTCTDIDECTAGTDNCDVHAQCTNTAGSFTCACIAGYSGNGVTCTDIDECTTGTDNCDAHATCTNTVGSFTCTCNPGYTGDGVTCTDQDECAAGTDNCDANATCRNTVGSFTCVCNTGYIGNGVTCTDEDECAAGTDNCDANAACTNIVGSYTCVCNTGFTGNGITCTDVDECTSGLDNCDVNAQCTNTVGSFTCACNTGYTGNGVTCTDEDECASGTDNCDANAACTNTVGSYTCVCNTGFTGNGITCTDIDECTAGTDNCDVNAQCTNTAGSFTCACIAGYSGNGVTCTDIDECTTGTDNCDAHATCTNTVGSFTCTCNPGYTGDGVTCTDVDECASIPCLNGGQCINGQNMFTCICSSGWTGTTCQTGFVCNPDNTIDVSNLPANYSYFAMQNVTSGLDVECTVTPTSSTSVKISGCLKDLDILLTYSTYNGMSSNTLQGGKFVTTVLVKCLEIQDNGTVHNVNNTFEAALIISDDTYVAPTYSVDSFLSTNSTFVGSDVTWTITFPEEYILEVTSCTAQPGTDGSSSENVSLISDGGCTITDELISNFTDHGNGSVTATILAFKFYNNDYVFLRCDLKVCPNDSSPCDTQCSRMKRSLSKRSVYERAAREPESYYTRKVNTVLRVMEPAMLSGSTQLSPLNQSKSFAFAIFLILLSTQK